MKPYDFKNPQRSMMEPLMMYIFIPMITAIGILTIFALVTVIFYHDDGGKWLSYYPILEYIAEGSMAMSVILAIIYTILYYARGWNNKEKWGIIQ